MGKFLSGTGVGPYGPCYMKRKLQEVYGERIVICNDVGKSDFITLKIRQMKFYVNSLKSQKMWISRPKNKISLTLLLAC